MAAKVEVYSSPFCGYCARAKRLLSDKGAAFTDVDVDAESGRREEMVRRAGGRNTVPQIFIDGEPIGGCDELFALERAGKLDKKLAGPA